MKYTLALSLALVTAATHTAPFDTLKQAVFDLDVAAVQKLVATNSVTQAEKARALAIAEEVKKPYVPTKQLLRTGKDALKILGGSLLCDVALINFFVSGLAGKGAFDHFEVGLTKGGIKRTVAAVGFLAAGVTSAYYGVRNIMRGYTAFEAKEEMRKILSIIDILKA